MPTETVTLSFKARGERQVSRALNRIEENADQLRRTGEKMREVGQGLTIGVTAPLIAAGGAAIKMASDAQEAQNLFEKSMGGLTSEAERFVAQWSEATDLDPIATKERLATLQLLISNMGIASDRAFQMSKDLTQLTVDLASLRNVSFEQAFTKLQSGLSGEMEALRRWGINVSVAHIEQVALREGLIETGEEMSQQEKIIARYLAIMEQTTTEQDDFIDTQDQLANQLRTLKDQVKIAARSIGEDLIPVASDMVELAKDWAQTFGDMDAETRKTVITVAALAAAFGPLLQATGAFTQFLAFAPGAFSTIAKVAGGLAGVLSGPLLAALVGTGGLIWAFHQISDTGNPAADAISEVARSIDVMGQNAQQRLSDVQAIVRETGKLAALRAGRPLSGQAFGPSPTSREGVMGMLFGPRAPQFGGGGGGGGGGAAAARPTGLIGSLFGGGMDMDAFLEQQRSRAQQAFVQGSFPTIPGMGMGRRAAAATVGGGIASPALGGLDLEKIKGVSDDWSDLIDVTLESGDSARQLANTTIAAFGSMAQAAIRGSDQMVQAVTSAFTQIIQSVSGPQSLLPGWVGAAAGALGGIITAVASGGDSRSRPQPVTVENRDPIEVEDQSDRGPETVILQTIDSADPAQLEHDINRRSRRDGVTRLPFGDLEGRG